MTLVAEKAEPDHPESQSNPQFAMFVSVAKMAFSLTLR